MQNIFLEPILFGNGTDGAMSVSYYWCNQINFKQIYNCTSTKNCGTCFKIMKIQNGIEQLCNETPA